MKVDDTRSQQYLELYKLHATFANELTVVRQQVNKFYISLLSVLASFLTFVLFRDIVAVPSVIMLAFALFCCLLCVIWYAHIHSFKQLNSAKFKMLDELEGHLVLKPYAIEWKHVRKGQDSKTYRRLTSVEKYIPLLFATPFLCLILYQLCWWLF